MKPVAITGLGAVSPFGLGTEALWEGVTGGGVSFVPIPEAEYKHAPGLYGTVSQEALPKGSSLIARANEFAKFGYWAAQGALRDSRHKVGDGYQCALVSGSAVGYSVVSQFGDMLDMSRAQYLYHSSVNGVISVECRVRGMQIMLYSYESASTQAIGLAAQLVSSGRYTSVLAGGVEAYSRALHASYSTASKASPLDAPTPGDQPSMKPWHPARDGFVFSEGACYLLLEDLDAARARGAHIYGVIAGWGSSQTPSDDGYEIAADGRSLHEAIDGALSSAAIQAQGVETVIASGNGSVRKDAIELDVLVERFRHLPNSVTLSGYKHLLGETLGSSGAFSVALACLGFEQAAALPVIDGPAPLEAGALRWATGVESAKEHVLITDLGYRGDAAALLLRRN